VVLLPLGSSQRNLNVTNVFPPSVVFRIALILFIRWFGPWLNVLKTSTNWVVFSLVFLPLTFCPLQEFFSFQPLCAPFENFFSRVPWASLVSSPMIQTFPHLLRYVLSSPSAIGFLPRQFPNCRRATLSPIRDNPFVPPPKLSMGRMTLSPTPRDSWGPH